MPEPIAFGVMASIAVFCGSSSGYGSSYADAARDLGRELAQRGHELVYGGGRVGLMGIVADAALAAGGAVTGVITEQLDALEVGHDGLSRLEVEVDMHARKARMAELSDGVIVLPGGFGTYDEAFEILTWNQLGIVAVPVAFVDVDGFYAPLVQFITHAADAGFIKPEHAALAQCAPNAAAAVKIATSSPPAYSTKWVDGPPR